MADTLWNFQNDGWWYNHGEFGYSVHHADWGGPVTFDPRPISGTNQLYGDGAVTWKSADKFDFDAMDARDPDLGWVSTRRLPDLSGDLNTY